MQYTCSAVRSIDKSPLVRDPRPLRHTLCDSNMDGETCMKREDGHAVCGHSMSERHLPTRCAMTIVQDQSQRGWPRARFCTHGLVVGRLMTGCLVGRSSQLVGRRAALSADCALPVRELLCVERLPLYLTLFGSALLDMSVLPSPGVVFLHDRATGHVSERSARPRRWTCAVGLGAAWTGRLVGRLVWALGLGACRALGLGALSARID